MLIYLAGPMTGIEDWNVPAFAEMAERLRGHGFAVINPHELHEPSAAVEWSWYMRRDLPALCKADAIVLLRGWPFSRGARLEHHIAKELGMEIVEWYQLESWLSDRVG